MERSDWSREFHRQGAPRYNPLLSLTWGDFGALSDWSRAVSPPVGATCQFVSTDLIGREPSRDL